MKPQKAYMDVLRENLFTDTMADTVQKRLLAWFPTLQSSYRGVPERENKDLGRRAVPDGNLCEMLRSRGAILPQCATNCQPDLWQLDRAPQDLRARWLRLREYLATLPPSNVWPAM